jgi:hypothetical protein
MTVAEQFLVLYPIPRTRRLSGIRHDIKLNTAKLVS